MKKIIFISSILVYTLLSGCRNTALEKAYCSYVINIGEPCIEYTKKDITLDPKIKEARIKLHEAALKLVKEIKAQGD